MGSRDEKSKELFKETNLAGRLKRNIDKLHKYNRPKFAAVDAAF